MSYEFIKFQGRNLRQEDRITLTKSNSLGFPKKFYEDNDIKKYSHAVLYWDAKNKAIGVRFTNDKTEKSAFSVMKNTAGYGGGIVVRSFFKINGIDPKIYHGRYEWKKENIEGIGEMFIIELKEYAEKK
jgi:hypothetical protein